MDKLKLLAERCKAGVHITINEHRDYCSTVADECPAEDVPADIREKMIALDTMVRVQFYPDSPVGFYTVFHYDIEDAIEEALTLLERGSRDQNQSAQQD